MKVFTVKLMLLFISIEMLMRVWLCLDPYWYRKAVHDVRKDSIKYIFIGSSRVACSIVPTEFAHATGQTNSPVSVINMGAGYSTLVEHYFGLRRIAAAMPDGLKGVTIFLEAPQGVPSLETFKDNWLHPNSPDLLINTIALCDLWSFWIRSDTDFDLKFTVTAATLSEAIAMQGNGRLLLVSMKKILQKRNRIMPEQTDLSTSAGIRNDEAGIQNARLLAFSLAADQIKHERIFPRQNSGDTILKNIHDFVKGGGGRLILYRMPLSSVQEQVYTTDIGRENKVIAHDLLNTWAIPMLSPNMKTNDDDFPDYWHLRKSRSSEFTRSMAHAYIELVGTH